MAKLLIDLQSSLSRLITWPFNIAQA